MNFYALGQAAAFAKYGQDMSRRGFLGGLLGAAMAAPSAPPPPPAPTRVPAVMSMAAKEPQLAALQAIPALMNTPMKRRTFLSGYLANHALTRGLLRKAGITMPERRKVLTLSHKNDPVYSGMGADLVNAAFDL